MKISAHATDAGKYMVKATNAGGAAESIAEVVVIEAQPQPVIQLPQVHIQVCQRISVERLSVYKYP